MVSHQRSVLFAITRGGLAPPAPPSSGGLGGPARTTQHELAGSV